jgi:class 3 adenylate cyclase
MQTTIQEPDRPGSQRRHLAVLFADISGFTRLVESSEPEAVYQIVRPMMDEMVALVRLHSGEIQQVLGDGFMSVFGLRSSSGDEARRAVRAGLALVSASRSSARRGNPPVHIGIEYGEVLVTPSWENADFAVWGRPVNLAKRLCDNAGPGRVHIGPAAFERAGHSVRSARLVCTQLKGITGTVQAYSVTSRPEPQTMGVGRAILTCVPHAVRPTGREKCV